MALEQSHKECAKTNLVFDISFVTVSHFGNDSSQPENEMWWLRGRVSALVAREGKKLSLLKKYYGKRLTLRQCPYEHASDYCRVPS